MTKTQNQKGFTLIELLVVIAIIGILAGILFVAINPKKQTDKANAASIQSTMAGIPNAVVMDNAESFANACTAADKQITAVKGITGVSEDTACTADANGFVFEVKFDNNGTDEFYCVDGTGVHKGTAAQADATNKKCN